MRSTVLGGEVIAELKRVGSTNEWRKDVYVFAGTGRIAVQMDYITFPQNSQVRWLYQNPVTGSLRGTIVWSELDLFGLDVGNFNQSPPEEYHGSEILYPVNGDPTDLSGGCTLDGAPISCDSANGLLAGESATQCPNNQCSVTVRYNGITTFANWTTYADGYTGYVPTNAIYKGNGFIQPFDFGGKPRLVSRGRGSLRDTDISKLNGVGGNDERQLRESKWIYPWHLPHRRLSEDEVTNLRDDVKKVLNNGDCLDFITDLLFYAALLIKPVQVYSDGIPEQIVSMDVLGIFDSVRNNGGFYVNTLVDSVSSIRGNLMQETATVYLGLSDINPNQIVTEGRAILTIHELLHFNFSDYALSRAVTRITGTVPTDGYSNHWMEELNRHCNTRVLRNNSSN